MLGALGLEEDRILFSAAGRIGIDATGVAPDSIDRLRAEVRRIETWLRDATHARLRVSVVVRDTPHGSIPEQYIAASRAIRRAKLRSWSCIAGVPAGWDASELRASPPDSEAEAERDARLGQEAILQHNRYVLFEEPNAAATPNGNTWDLVGLRARFASSPLPSGDVPHARELSRLARHVPQEHGHPVEFVDLATRHARGAPMLGVLKADADSLGIAIGRRLANAKDLHPLRQLSKELEKFFSVDLDREVKGDARWAKLYTIFSGGDDLLMVGPWDIVLDFAGRLRQRFVDTFRADRLTLSAGIAIVKPKFPIHLAVQQAERSLEAAKSGTKDQCALLGDVWNWKRHEAILRAGSNLADWVESGDIQRGWLHTLLELAQLRRGESLSRPPGSPPAMATARLAYHIARNWPKPPHPARQWIDQVLREFDQYASSSHVETVHFPAILRYAMLATRSQGDDS